MDITDLKRAEAALRDSKERFRLFMDNSPTLAWIKDEEGRYVYLSKTYEHRFGARLADWCGKTDAELWPAQIAEEFRRNDLAVLAAGHPVEMIEETVDLNGSPCYWLNSKFPFHDAAGNRLVAGVGVDITDLKKTEEALRKARDQLEMRVKERTAELSDAVQRLRVENIQRTELEETLRDSENRLRFFAAQYLTAQEDERKKIAGELHDSISASLGAMAFKIAKIAEEVEQGPGASESLKDLGSNVAEINKEIRRIMADLRPSVLDDLGIIAALDWFCREYQKTYSHISLEKQILILSHEVPDLLSTPIFRIFQEAMNNIAKYSRASLVNISIRKEGNEIQLIIQDNGQGFDLGSVKRGLGLTTMRERAQLSGGRFKLESARGQGTKVCASWPFGGIR